MNANQKEVFQAITHAEPSLLLSLNPFIRLSDSESLVAIFGAEY